MARVKQARVVISKIEITKSPTKLAEKQNVDARSLSLQQYHTDVNKMGKEIAKYALSLSDNMLSVKMALMQAVQEVERKMRENKEH